MIGLKSLAFIIPAHNEGIFIAESLKSLSSLTDRENIFVVDDGSTDETEKIARQFTNNVLSLKYCVGKARALNRGIIKFKLTDNYKYIALMDADTVVTPSFIANTVSLLDKDVSKKLICIVGKVIADNQSVTSLFRLWEYEIAQSIHKSAQSLENAIVVCPGCATVYRSDIFKKNPIPTDTLTEDMDYTFLIHRKNLGKIIYLNNAIVITHDPNNLKDYLIQIKRWYTGFWQCLTKHNIPWGGQMLDLEVALLASEGLFFGLMVISTLILIPTFFIKNPQILIIFILMDMLVFTLPTIIVTSIRHRLKQLILYIPHFYFIRFISSLMFLFCFIKVTLGSDYHLKWS